MCLIQELGSFSTSISLRTRSSCRLTPAEQRCGEPRTAGGVLALLEWLEGATQPFIVWTDHKNLSYLHSAKRLDSRQALFLGQFNFTLTHALVQKMSNQTPSHQFTPEEEENHMGTILPPVCMVGVVRWQMEQEVLCTSMSPFMLTSGL